MLQDQHKKLPKVVVLLILLFITTPILAHSINYALQDAPTHEVFGFYIKLGFQHIIPLGYDHILFIAGLCLLSTNIKTILLQATAFTIAHSITLALSMKSVVTLPAGVVEPIIALSIVFVAIENILLAELKPWRIVIVFLFGLIHGLGFASALNEIGLPPNQFFNSTLAFNLGVELGQVAVIIALFIFIILPLRKKTGYRKWIVNPLSLMIAVIAGWWTIERIM